MTTNGGQVIGEATTVMEKPGPVVIETHSAEETRALGVRLAALLRPGDVLLLHGDLGAGKTTLTQGIAAGLGIGEPVQSPTFTLAAEHAGSAPTGEPLTLYHLDLYRLGGPEDLESIGFDDYLAPANGVTVIEWPERAEGWLPDRYLAVTLTAAGPDARSIGIRPHPSERSLDARLAAWADVLRLPGNRHEQAVERFRSA